MTWSLSRPDRELSDAAALCGHLSGDGLVFLLLAERRRWLFPDEMFVDLFRAEGRSSVPDDVIAAVMVLRAGEGRSDRQACQALAADRARHQLAHRPRRMVTTP